MKKFVIILLCLFFAFGFSQYVQNIEIDTIQSVEPAIDYEQEKEFVLPEYKGKKNTNYYKLRKFNKDLNDVYGFEYKEKKKKPKENKFELNKKTISYVGKFFNFFGSIIPYILAILVILIIVKFALGSDANFWKFGKKSREKEQLIYEEFENIEKSDFEKLIQNALKNNNYRLAVRYYYLLVLQKLSERELIDYHKDKTNTEYQFEIKNVDLRNEFSYISYIYNYVWYGEFDVDLFKFKVIETSFNNFLKSV